MNGKNCRFERDLPEVKKDKNLYNLTSGQDGGVGRYIHFASLHNQNKDNNEFKNTK